MSTIRSSPKSPKAKHIISLLEIVRIHNRKEVPNVSPVALACMFEMGFASTDIQEALHVCRNNPTVACEWLCGDREGATYEAETGFPRGSSIVKTLIENPHFQQGLESPKMFMGSF